MLQQLPPITKNILLINILLFLASQAFPILDYQFALFYFQSPHFQPWQLITHMFMHGSITHIFFNMFGVYMFGSVLERYWGGKKFLLFYLISGLGALTLHEFIAWREVQSLVHQLPPQIAQEAFNDTLTRVNPEYFDAAQSLLNAINTPMVGASGCLFGLLMAYGFMFPNSEMMLMFIPYPIKAKYFVIGYGAIELLMALSNRSSDHVAHFAHLGGMLIGYIMLKYWQSRNALYSHDL
ncbi:MAG: rhomboid family intramembrane serine protease [Flavobacteriales bacterium]